jgi:hypothetical protein
MPDLARQLHRMENQQSGDLGVRGTARPQRSRSQANKMDDATALPGYTAAKLPTPLGTGARPRRRANNGRKINRLGLSPRIGLARDPGPAEGW